MRLTMRLTMAMVAVAAFALSFESLMELGALAGYGRLAFLYPVVVDLGTVSSCTAWLHTRSRQAFWMTWTLLSVSVIQNGTVHWLLATGQQPAWWLITLVATVPPATLGLVVHLGVGLGADVAKKYPQVSEGAAEKSTGTPDNSNLVAGVLPEKYPAGNPAGENGQDVGAHDPPAEASPNLGEAFDPVAELIQQGAGRRTIASQLGVTEYKARQLIASTRISRNGDSHVPT